MLGTYMAIGAGVLIAGVGAGVWLSGIRIHIRRLFFFFTIGLSMWSISFGLLNLTHNFFFNQFIFYALFPIFGGLFLFVLAYPSAQSTPRWAYAAILPSLLVASGGAFNVYVSGMRVLADSSIRPVNGPLMPLFTITTCAYLIVSVLILVIRFRRAVTYRERLRFWYLISGLCAVALSMALFDVLLPTFEITLFVPMGYISIALFCIFVAYAIVRYELLDIRLAIQRGFIYSLLFAFISTTYTALLLVLSSLFSIRVQHAAHISAACVMLVGIATVPMLDHYLRRKTDKIFFKDRYDYKDALQELSAILHTHSTSEEIVAESLVALERILRVMYVSFIPHSSVDALRKKDPSVLIFPVFSKRGKIGTLIIGERRSGETFLPEDVVLIDTFSVQLAIALDKAELYEQLKEYSRVLEERVAARTQEITALREQERRMFSDISHALQTPLTVLKSGVEIIARKTRDSATLSVMERSIETASQLVYSLLRITRLESRVEELPMEEVCASELVSRVVEYVDTICTQHSIALESQVEPGIHVHGNSAQIEEVLTNLLSNAVKYTRTSPLRRITVTLERSRASVILTVADTGVGISPDKLPYIFDRFYRAHAGAALAPEGTGLGLAICKRIVGEHGGSISVESSEGAGATFTVLLPQCPTSESDPFVQGLARVCWEIPS